MSIYTAELQKFYISYFNRPADVAGLAYWEAQLAAGTQTLAQAQNGFSSSAEYQAIYTGTSDAVLLNTLYGNLFGRAATLADLNYWMPRLADGTDTVNTIANSLASNAGPTDLIAITNKITAATSFTAELISTGETGYTNATATAYDTARTWLDGVTTDATLTAALSTQTATIAVAVAGTVGAIFELTTSTDTIIGTEGNDTITATSSTLAAADIVLDSTSTDNDTLNLTLTANNAAATITGVENVNVDWNAFGTAGIIATNISGATITGTSTKAGFLGHMTITDAGNNTIVAGTGMSGTLTVNGGQSVTVDGGASKTIVVNGTGTAADDLSATVTAGTSTTSVTVGTTNAFKSNTIDAGTATTIAIADQGTTSTTSLTVGKSATVTNTGTGTLALTVGAASVTTTLSAVGKSLDIQGAQSTTLKAASANLTAETVTNSLTAGTLTVAINGAIGADADLSAVEADLFTISTATGGDFATAVASGSSISASVDIGNGEFGVATADDSSADTLTITSTNATQTIIQVDGLDATLGDIETTTIVCEATAVSGTDMTITDIEAGTNKVILTGTNDVVVTEVIAKTVDASGLTGNLTITQQAANTAAMTISGATGTNVVVFTATTNDSSYTGQNGNDTVTFVNTTGNATAVLGNGANTVTSSSGTTGSLVVMGGDGVDTVTASTAGTGTGEVNLGLGAGNDVATITTGGTDDVVTIDMGEGTNSLTLAAASTANDVHTLTFGTGTDTLNLSTDITAGTWTITGLDVIALGGNTAGAKINSSILTGQTYEITGDGGTTDTALVEMDAAASVDFSGIVVNQTITKGLKGLEITDSTGIDTIVATAYADKITTQAGSANTITGGQGADTLVGSTATDTFVINSGDTGKATGEIDVITTSWTSGTDKIKWGVAGSVTNYAEAAGTYDGLNVTAGVATVELMLTQANAALDGTVVLFITDNANANTGGVASAATKTYAFFDRNADGTADEVIELVGAVFSAYAFGDFIA